MTQQSHPWAYIWKKLQLRKINVPQCSQQPIYKSQDIETTWISPDRWMDKDKVHIYNGILLSHKKEWNNAICSNMNRSRDYHRSEVSQKEKDKYDVISLICGI